MTKISKDGITVEIGVETLRHRFHRIALYATALELIEDLANELGMSEAIIEDTLIRFYRFSIRGKVTKGKLDFEMPLHNDTPEQIKAKFNQLLDSKYVTLVDDVNVAIDKMDRVQDVDLAPTPLPEDADKKK